MITIDFETKSYADLKKVGAWAYSEDPTTDLICLAWGRGTEEIQTWWPGKNPDDGIPFSLAEAIALGVRLEAHNVAFERSIWVNVLQKKYGWPELSEDIWEDTMAVAAYYGLPQGLDRLARVLGFESKDPEGSRLISKYSKLNLKTAKTEIPQEDFDKFVAYCVKDVQVEQSVSDFLGDLPEREQPVFQLDQKINMRGLYLDQAGIDAATEIADKVSEDLTKRFRKITGLNPGQNAKLIDWFEGQGLWLENLQKDPLTELLEEGDLPQGPCREAIELRLAINKASTKKLDAMSRQRGKDGRARFQMTYHGAATGRWTGRGFQPLNLNRGFEKLDPEQLVRDIMYRDPEYLQMLYGSSMDAIGKASRHWIQAQEGNRILAGDFVSIEAVILAVLAGETWKVDAFAEGKKIYELMGDKIYKLSPGTVTKKSHPAERQDGKTCLGAGTRVLTQEGWKPIILVKPQDKLWDGVEWVRHDGLLDQGLKPVIDLEGVEITPDHLILTQEGWELAEEVASCESMMNQASAKGLVSLPSSGINGEQLEGSRPYGLSAPAAGTNIWFQKQISGTREAPAALNAREVRLPSGAKNTSGTQISAPTTRIDAGYSTEYLPALRAVNLRGTRTMEAEAFEYGDPGQRVLRAGENSSSILCHLTDGISQNLRSTASTLTKAINLVISGLLRAAKTRLTNGASKTFNDGSMNLKLVYDLANAGPRKRFTILTAEGPMIVHNCELAFGYQGALGAWLKFDSSGRHTDERIIEICKSWRGEHPMIVAFWGGLEEAAIAACFSKQTENFRDIGFEIVDEWLSMILPNGKRIWYWNPEVRMTMPQWHKPREFEDCALGTCKCQPRPQLTYMSQKEGQWKRVWTYGGKLTENAVQATSRELLVPAMFRAEEANYPIILTVYDEVVSEVPVAYGSEQEFKEILAERPDFAKTWPIGVDTWEGDRYKK